MIEKSGRQIEKVWSSHFIMRKCAMIIFLSVYGDHTVRKQPLNVCQSSLINDEKSKSTKQYCLFFNRTKTKQQTYKVFSLFLCYSQIYRYIYEAHRSMKFIALLSSKTTLVVYYKPNLINKKVDNRTDFVFFHT